MPYRAEEDVRQVLNREGNQKSMLTEYFKENQDFPWARGLLYREFPEYARWWPGKKQWTKRQQRAQIGRIVSAHPGEGERYYLRVLLNHVSGATSLESLKTYDGIMYLHFEKPPKKRTHRSR